MRSSSSCDRLGWRTGRPWPAVKGFSILYCLGLLEYFPRPYKQLLETIKGIICRHSYENAPTPLSIAPLNPSIPRSRHSGPSIRHSREGGNPEGWGEGIVARGLVPRWGRGGAWQNPPCRFAVPNHNSRFSHLGVPAPAGMGDCYESMSRTPIRDTPSNQPRCRLSTGETCRIVDRWPMAE